MIRTMKILLLGGLFVGVFAATHFSQLTGPRDVLPPVTVSGSALGDVRWILPGPRALDPEVFGTPTAPLGFEPDVGVPLAERLTNEAGTAYTTTQGPTPMSDRWEQVSGTLFFVVKDVTAFDGPSTKDEIDFEATFTGPDLTLYQIKVSRALPQGPDHQFFGGVGTNVLMHGKTGIGSKLQPTAFAWVTFWGVGQLSRDGQVVADDQLVHLMLTQRVRSDDEDGYRLGFDADLVGFSGHHIHLLLPPVAITPEGLQDRPVPTEFTLPNGQQQPFIHLMFENVLGLSAKLED